LWLPLLDDERLANGGQDEFERLLDFHEPLDCKVTELLRFHCYFFRLASRFFEYAMATAWRIGFPALTSALIFSLKAAGDLLVFSGISASHSCR